MSLTLFEHSRRRGASALAPAARYAWRAGGRFCRRILAGPQGGAILCSRGASLCTLCMGFPCNFLDFVRFLKTVDTFSTDGRLGPKQALHDSWTCHWSGFLQKLGTRSNECGSGLRTSDKAGQIHHDELNEIGIYLHTNHTALNYILSKIHARSEWAQVSFMTFSWDALKLLDLAWLHLLGGVVLSGTSFLVTQCVHQ